MMTQSVAGADRPTGIGRPDAGNRLIPGPDPDTTIPREES